MKNLLTLTTLAAVLLASCSKDEGSVSYDPVATTGNQLTMDHLGPTTNHTFNQHETWNGVVHVEGYDGALAGIPLLLMNGEQVLERGWTDQDGDWALVINHTPSMDLKVQCNMPTLQSTYPIVDQQFSITMEPSHVRASNAEALERSSAKTNQTTVSHRGGAWYDDRTYSYQSSRGATLPTMVAPDTISDSFLTHIANSVPEDYPVAIHNPSLLAEGSTSIYLKDSADVWMTFVDEGAGYRNSVGVFSYTASSIPSLASDIDTIWTVFENFSRKWAGGGLLAGDKVYIGSYPAGTYVGFALTANGFSSQGSSFRNNPTYYSIPEINPESNAAKLQHNILLYDQNNSRFVIGFEDLPRSNGHSDEDFNDALFYCTSNPYTAIDTTGVTPIVEELDDCDYDGIPDNADVAPCDARYATTYSTGGRLMFEDLYPYLGDYDFNDIVVDYAVLAWKNADGVVTKMDYDFTLKADGGTLTNGLGLSIDNLNSSSVSNVTFSDENGYFESGDEAVFILTPNCSFDGYGYMNNIIGGNSTANFPVYSVSFEVNGASVSDVFWGASMNPMIFQDLDNGLRNEVHLKFKKPTENADQSLIGTGNDITLLEDVLFTGQWSTASPAVRYWATLLHQGNATTLPKTAFTYTDTNGYPWAMHVDSNASYPVEKTAITEAFTTFSAWVESGGVTHTNWFTTIVSGKVYQ